MIDLTAFVTSKLLLTAGRVSEEYLKNLLIRTMPIEANVIANSSLPELEKEISDYIKIINDRAPGCVINESGTLTLSTSAECVKALAEVVERYEWLLAKRIAPLGVLLKPVEDFVERHTKQYLLMTASKEGNAVCKHIEEVIMILRNLKDDPYWRDRLAWYEEMRKKFCVQE